MDGVMGGKSSLRFPSLLAKNAVLVWLIQLIGCTASVGHRGVEILERLVEMISRLPEEQW